MNINLSSRGPCHNHVLACRSIVQSTADRDPLFQYTCVTFLTFFLILITFVLNSPIQPTSKDTFGLLSGSSCLSFHHEP